MRLLHSGQALVQALKWKSEAGVIDSHAVQNGGVEFVEVHGVAGDVVAEIIGGAMGDAGLDAAAGHPHTKIARVMIATVVLASEFALTINRAAKFAAEDHQRVIKHAALFEVFDECGGRLIDIHALVFDVGGKRAVLIPASMENLHGSHTALDESPGEERRVREGAGLLGVGAVHLEGGFAFIAEVGEFGYARLHAESHFVLGDARLRFRIAKSLKGFLV